MQPKSFHRIAVLGGRTGPGKTSYVSRLKSQMQNRTGPFQKMVFEKPVECDISDMRGISNVA